MSKTLRMVRGFLPAGPLLGERWVLSQIRRSLCSLAESAELPNWFKSAEKSSTAEDDFLLPSELDNGEYRRIRTPESSDCSDADALSRLLKRPLASPEAALLALDGCKLEVTGELVDKMLRRFCNDWISAFGFFNWADSTAGYSHSQHSYDSMVDILGKAKQFERMWSLIDEMVQLGQMVTLTTMTKVMRRLSGARRWRQAVEAFHAIEQFGVKKDTASMNVILDTLCKEHAVKRARDLFLEIRDSIPPDARTFNTLIHGWCKARKFDEGRWTMEEMERCGFKPCVVSYTSFIKVHCLDRNFHEVDLVLDEMKAKGCQPNVVTYTIIMHAHGKAKNTQEALLVYDKMKNTGCTPDADFYNSLIYLLTNAGRMQDACEVYEEMKNDHIKPNLTTYNTLIAAFCRRSEEERAMKVLQEMEDSSCTPDIMTFAPLLKMECMANQMEMLQFLLEHMVKKDVSLDLATYCLLVSWLSRSGCLVQACSFFEEMVMKGFLPRYPSYVELMEKLEQRHMVEGMEKIRNLMAKAHRMASGSYQVPDKYKNASVGI